MGMLYRLISRFCILLYYLRIMSNFAHTGHYLKVIQTTLLILALKSYINETSAHNSTLRWNRSKYLFFSEQNFIRILWYARRNLSNRKSEVRNTCTKPWAKFINNYETIILRNITNQVSILSESVIMLSLISNKRSFIASFSEHLMQGITDTWHQHTKKSAQKYERLGSKIWIVC